MLFMSQRRKSKPIFKKSHGTKTMFRSFMFFCIFPSQESPNEQPRHPFGIVGSSSQLVTVPGSELSAGKGFPCDQPCVCRRGGREKISSLQPELPECPSFHQCLSDFCWLHQCNLQEWGWRADSCKDENVSGIQIEKEVTQLSTLTKGSFSANTLLCTDWKRLNHNFVWTPHVLTLWCAGYKCNYTTKN